MTFLLSSITPVIIFLFLVYHRDHINVPIKLLIYCFLGGFLAYFSAFIFELIGMIFINQISNHFLNTFGRSFLNAALPEELAKFSILYLIIWKKNSFDHYYSGIIYAVFVSLGLALIENITYLYQHGLNIAVTRAVLAVPMHGFCAVIMGYYFSKAKFGTPEERRKYLRKSFFIPIIFHGSYDFPLMYLRITDDPLLLFFLIIFFAITVIEFWRLGIKDIKLLTNR